ncbi:MAG: 50S ribosomal protein L11 methyltransferase, partial [Peptostreptococcaceae bacterium]|nr:50S ribosomal protein L11 methyltransferase [Peptostreptococcaceae bacterium]
MNWNEISISTTTEATEIISNIFIEIGSKGVLIEDPSDFYFQEKDTLAWDYIEEEVFDYGHEDVKIIAYFSQEENIEEKISDLKKRLDNIGDVGVDLGSLE